MGVKKNKECYLTVYISSSEMSVCIFNASSPETCIWSCITDIVPDMLYRKNFLPTHLLEKAITRAIAQQQLLTYAAIASDYTITHAYIPSADIVSYVEKNTTQLLPEQTYALVSGYVHTPADNNRYVTSMYHTIIIQLLCIFKKNALPLLIISDKYGAYAYHCFTNHTIQYDASLAQSDEVTKKIINTPCNETCTLFFDQITHDENQKKELSIIHQGLITMIQRELWK